MGNLLQTEIEHNEEEELVSLVEQNEQVEQNELMELDKLVEPVEQDKLVESIEQVQLVESIEQDELMESIEQDELMEQVELDKRVEQKQNKEVIISIKKVDDKQLDSHAYYDIYIGYEIITSEQIIHVFISNFSQCCENWFIDLYQDHNNLVGEDQYINFIGKEVQHVGWNYKYNAGSEFSDGDPHACVEIKTSNGSMYILACNQHNGYYPHTLYTKWKDHEDSQEL